MASRTRPLRRVSIQNRTRSGCAACRKGHVKCDETRPSCSRCTRSLLSCRYILKLTWEEDARSSGKCHGRAGVWSKNKTRQNDAESKQLVSSSLRQTMSKRASALQCYTITLTSFLNTTSHDMRMYYSRVRYRRPREDDFLSSSPVPENTILPSTADRPPEQTIVHSSVLGQKDGTIKRAQEIDNMLMSYYRDIVCQDATQIQRDDEQDPRQHILSRALVSPHVALGVMMIAANFLGMEDKRFAVLSMEYRQLCLSALEGGLVSGECEPGDVALLAVMLCSAEISDQCRPTWISHFAVFRDMIDQRLGKSNTKYQYDYTYRLCCRYFSFHLVIAKTVFPIEEDDASKRDSSVVTSPMRIDTSKRKTREQSWTSSENLSLIMNEKKLGEIDPYSGFSYSLLLLMNEIADLKYDLSAGTNIPVIDPESTDKIARLKLSLTTLQQYVSPLTATSDSDVVEVLKQTAESYRLAALILLHQSFTSSPHLVQMVVPVNNGKEEHATRGESSLSSETDQAVFIRKVLDLVRTIIAKSVVLPVAWPLWPLFIAGCCTNDGKDKLAVIELFETAQEMSKVGNIAPAFKVVKTMWKQRDLRADEEVCDRTMRRRRQKQLDEQRSVEEQSMFGGWYEWGWIMVMIGCRVSLA